MHRRHPLDEEPLTFTYRDIAELLHSAGYERFAKHVRELGQHRRDAGQIDREWRDKYTALLARLHVYEPPAEPVYDRNGKPGPMSDG